MIEQRTNAALRGRPARTRGFSLMETMIVLAVLGVLLAIAVGALLAVRRSATNEDLKAQQAREYQQLALAAAKYINANRASWALGSRNAIGVGTLITAGHLPSSFGARFGSANGRSPFGATYNIVSIKDATDQNVVRTVIFETGTNLASQLSKVNVENTATAIQGLKEATAQKVQTDHKFVTGFMPALSMIARGSMSAFTKDLTAWVQTAPAQASSVLFMGFPDLGDTCATPPCPPPSGPRYEDCVVVQATCSQGWVEPYCGPGQVVTPTCPAGKVEAGSYPHCGHNQTVFSSTDVGSLTMGSYIRQPRPHASEDGFGYNCNAGCNANCSPQNSPNLFNTHRYGTVSLNNVVIAEYLCSVQYTRTNQFSCSLESGTANWPTTLPNSGRDKICCSVRN